jgi:hypothetical protein
LAQQINHKNINIVNQIVCFITNLFVLYVNILLLNPQLQITVKIKIYGRIQLYQKIKWGEKNLWGRLEHLRKLTSQKAMLARANTYAIKMKEIFNK